VEELPPGEVVFGRVLVGALGLLPAVPFMIGWRRLFAELRSRLLPLVVLGLFNASVPFWLLPWSEQRLDSLAAVLQASTPLFAAGLALGFSRPFGIAQWPAHTPSWKAIGSVLALGTGTLLPRRRAVVCETP
jgi:EamA-like transporter family